MKESDILDNNELTIESMPGFVDDQEEVYKLLDRGANDILEMKDIDNSIQQKLEDMMSNLSKLKHCSIGKFDNSIGNDYSKKVEELKKVYSEKAAKIVATSQITIELIEAYNEGKDVSIDVNEILKSLSDLGVFWVAKAVTEGRPGLYGLASLMAYKTDEMYDDSLFIVGDGTVEIVELLKSDPAMAGVFKGTSDIGIGTIAVAIYSIVTNYQRLHDEGEFTRKDGMRLVGEVSSDAVAYYSWSKVADIVAKEIGGAAGGPVGALVATGVSFVTTSTIGAVKDYATGDIVIHTIDRAGRTYEVPRNGSGESGTYDVQLGNYTKLNPNRTIDGKRYSETNYKNILYDNWEDVYKNARTTYGDNTVKKFNKSLEKLKNIDNPQEAEAYMETIENNFSHAPQSMYDTVGLYDQLEATDFDLHEYYNYYHPKESGKGSE